MGQKSGKDLKSPELDGLANLRKYHWAEKDWHEIFTLCGDNDEYLLPKQATRFFRKLFKYLELPGNNRQFVANVMLRLDVQRKGRLLWKDVLLLHQCLRVMGAKPAPMPLDDLATRIVRLSDVCANFRDNLEVLGPMLDQVKVGQKKQDGGLREAFFATFDLLLALHELDNPRWNKIKERLYVSFVKKSPTTNTSVTSGLATSFLKPGQSIGILNCGTGPIKFQFYKMDEEQVARVLIDFTPPEEQELYITSATDPEKLVALREGIGNALSYLRMKQRHIPVVALVTGELREKHAKSDPQAALALDTVLQKVFQGLDVQPWATLFAGKYKMSFFLPQHVEGRFEDVACGNLIKDLAPQHDVLVSCGIGRGTCQWSTRYTTIGHGFGMNNPEKLVGGDISLRKTILDAFSPAYIAELESLSLSMDMPVIALKSGCLLLQERNPDLIHLFTRSTADSTAAFTGFAKGQTLLCHVEDAFRFVQVEDMASSGRCAVTCDGDSMVLQLGTFSAAVPVAIYDKPAPNTTTTKALRFEHARRRLPPGYFALIQDKPRPQDSAYEFSTPVLFENKEVGMAYCSRGKWADCISAGAGIYFELSEKLILPYSSSGNDEHVQFALKQRPDLKFSVEKTWVACFPIGYSLDFGKFLATLQSMAEDGEYTWRIQEWKSGGDRKLFGDREFDWPTPSNRLVARTCTVFSYKPGAQLLILDEKGEWQDAQVSERLGGNLHRLEINGDAEKKDISLSGSNHVWNSVGLKETFDHQLREYRSLVSEKYGYLEDALTGRKLQTDLQLLNLELKNFGSGANSAPISDVRVLIKHMASTSDAHVLVLAAAGTGKTFTMRQLVLLTQREQESLVPICIVVQRLANFIRKQPRTALKLCDHNFVEFYLRQDVVKPTQLQFLLQSVRMRQVLIAVDGIDEASDFKQEIVRWILSQLHGIRTVVTSRPEGLSQASMDQMQSVGFLFVNIRPLSPQQQQKAIELQLQDNAYYKNLLAFSGIRSRHDNLYDSMDEADRVSIESFASFDKIKKNAGMRQKNLAGQVVCYYKGKPRSKTLQVPNANLLQNLAEKLRKSEDEVWGCIVSSTDELYQVAELVQEPIKNWLETICKEFDARLEFAHKLKDPVRVFEKAEDDYKKEFDDRDITPPTGCVMDVVRSRVYVNSLKTKVAIMNKLLNKSPSWISVVRVKNKCSPGLLDATHLRNVLTNLEIQLCSVCGALGNSCACGVTTSHIFEIQLYHEQVFQLAEDACQHHYYEALRTMLREDAMRKQVDFVLDKQMTLFDRVGQVPVLLSMLVLVLGDDNCLPTTVVDLYRLAIKAAIRRFAVRAKSTNTDTWEGAVYQLLQLVAFNAQSRGVAALAQTDLLKWQLDMNLWNEICGVGESIKGDITFSAIKTISQNEEYRFAHLSIQEFLYLDYLRTLQVNPDFAILLRDPKFDNVLRIGLSSPEMAHWILGGESNFRIRPEDNRQVSLLFELARYPGLRSLVIELHDGLKHGDFAQERAELRACSVQMIYLGTAICLIRPETVKLDLSSLEITDQGLENLSKELVGLEWLDLGSNQITAAGIETLATELKTSQLKFLGLAQNPFSETGVSHFLEIVQQGVLMQWQLSSTIIPLENIAQSIAKKFPGLNYFSGSWIRYSLVIASDKLDLDPESALASDRKMPPKKISSRRLLTLRQSKPDPKPEEKKTSRKIDRALASQNKNKKPEGVIFGIGASRIALFHELVRAHDEIPQNQRSLEAARVQGFVLKCAQILATAVPHYGCPMACSPQLMRLCQTVIEAPALDEKTAAAVERLWGEKYVKRALLASQRGHFDFPQQMTLLFDRVQAISKSNYVPETEDILYWKDSELIVHEYRCSVEQASFCFVAGGLKLLKLFEQEGGEVLLIAAPFREVQGVSGFRYIIAYSNPPWTQEEASQWGKRVFPISSLKEIVPVLKKIQMSKFESSYLIGLSVDPS